MAKISIINGNAGDDCVVVDGAALRFDLEGLVPEYVWAITFDTATKRGELQYRDDRQPVALEDDELVAPPLQRYEQIAAALQAQRNAEQQAQEALLRSRGYAQDLIDMAAGRARARFIAIGTAVEQEYRLTLDQANAFKARGYTNPVPPTVKAHAEAFGVDPVAAADEIVATAALWYAALEHIRAQRLKGKAAVTAAPEAADFSVVAAPYIAAMDALQP